MNLPFHLWSTTLLAVFFVLGSVQAQAPEWTFLSMAGDTTSSWHFVGGEWDQDGDGVIQPPHNLTDENIALFTKHAYRDFEVEFEFRWDVVWTTAALVFGAKNATDYYVVDFPVVGQQYRAEHFWGCVSKVDERNWREGIHMQMVPGVSSAPTLWHQVRVVVQGEEIRVSVDGRRMSTVRVPDLRPGLVGLLSYSSSGASAKSSFRNLKIRGKALDFPDWNRHAKPRRNWGIMDPNQGRGCSNIVRAANGDLVLFSGLSDEGNGIARRSSDNGRTWTQDVTSLPEHVSRGLLHATRDGKLNVYSVAARQPHKIRRARSSDHGRTWSEAEEVGEIRFPDDFQIPKSEIYPTCLVETRKGSLLLFAYAREEFQMKNVRGRVDRFKTGVSGMNLCLRSTDGGKTWSDPIDIDGPPHTEPWLIRKEASEISVTQTPRGDLLALVRPWASPVMWESRSKDDGKTWTPLARGAFPMYACNNSIITTSSGAIVMGGRFPGMALQVSRDNGMSWQFYQIDRAAWANGAMVEVEPDVVLYVYGGLMDPNKMRYQLIRVTPDRLEPIRAEKTFADIVYVWGITEDMDTYEIGGKLIHTRDPAKFAQADAPSKAAMLDVQNIIMAGEGLPKELEAARRVTREISHLKRVVWELNPDDLEKPNIYTNKLKILADVKTKGPALQAVILDDPVRWTPEVGASLRAQLHEAHPGLELWGAIYAWLFKDDNQMGFLPFLDSILLSFWYSEEIHDMEKHVATIEERAPGKPIVVNLYMYDYGHKRKMPRDMMKLQCEKALALAKAGRVKSIIFLAVNNDADTIVWTRDWIRRHADEKIPASR